MPAPCSPVTGPRPGGILVFGRLGLRHTAPTGPGVGEGSGASVLSRGGRRLTALPVPRPPTSRSGRWGQRLGASSESPVTPQPRPSVGMPGGAARGQPPSARAQQSSSSRGGKDKPGREPGQDRVPASQNGLLHAGRRLSHSALQGPLTDEGQEPEDQLRAFRLSGPALPAARQTPSSDTGTNRRPPAHIAATCPAWRSRRGRSSKGLSGAEPQGREVLCPAGPADAPLAPEAMELPVRRSAMGVPFAGAGTSSCPLGAAQTPERSRGRSTLTGFLGAQTQAHGALPRERRGTRASPAGSRHVNPRPVGPKDRPVAAARTPSPRTHQS